MNQRAWKCPHCGTIRTCPDPGYWTPNINCKCKLMDEGFITEMEELVPVSRCTEAQNDRAVEN